MALELIFLDGPQAGRRFSLGSAPVTFGRAPTAGLSFPQDTFISGMHLSAQAIPQGIMLTDLKSTNGTFLNGERISQAIAVKGDVIRIGSLTMQLADAQSIVSGPILSSPAVKPTGTSVPPPVAPSLPRRNDAVHNLLRSAEAPLFCLLDASADEMIPSLLSLAQDDVRRQSLFEGDAGSTLMHWPPYLVSLPANSPLLDVLVAKGWGKGWACFFTSPATFEDLQRHFSKFLMVQLEQGAPVYFRFYDPRVLRTFLPAASSAEASMFFGPVAEWFLESATDAGAVRIKNTVAGLAIQSVPATASPLLTQVVPAFR